MSRRLAAIEDRRAPHHSGASQALAASLYRLLRRIFLQEQPHRPRLGRASTIGFFALLAVLFILYVGIDGRVNAGYSAIHFAIIGLSMLHLIWLRRFNLGASFSLFTLFFFGVIPLFEYRLGITYNNASTPLDSSYEIAAGLALLSNVCFYVGYGLKRGRPLDVTSLKRLRYLSARHRQIVGIAAWITLVLMALSVAAFYQFSLHSILFRGYGEEMEQSAMGNAFITYFARPLFFNVMLIMLLNTVRRDPVSRTRVFAQCCLVFLVVSPIGIPRSLAGALYIPMMMLVFMPKYLSKYSVLCVILFAVLLAAPVADLFRDINHSEGGVDVGQNFNLAYLFSGHFDAFHNLAQVVELKYRSEGWQVVGILLFWVPRAFWEGKPQSTSFDFADFAGYAAHNISFSLPAEFYVDYGVGGIAVGMFIVGLLYRRIDLFFSRRKLEGSIGSYVYALGHFELSVLGLYLIRGSVLSSFAYTVGLASTLMTIRVGERIIRGLVVRRSVAQPALT
jgi:oligosaccharide repeat unit polymerase